MDPFICMWCLQIPFKFSKKKHAQHFSLNHIMPSVTVAGLQLQSPCMNPFIFRIPFKTSFISSFFCSHWLPALQPPCPTTSLPYMADTSPKAKLHGFLSFFWGLFKGFLSFFECLFRGSLSFFKGLFKGFLSLIRAPFKGSIASPQRTSTYSCMFCIYSSSD